MIDKKRHWLWTPAKEAKGEYLNVILASVFINIFALASSFYIMTVYDKVIPNNSTDTLIALSIGILLVVWFDFIMKIMRGVFTDNANEVIDKDISKKLFDKINQPNGITKKKSVGNLISIIKDVDIIKDVLGSATFVALVDLPFIILFLFVLYLLGGWIMLVPLTIILMVIISALIINPKAKRALLENTIDGQTKQGLLVEMLNGRDELRNIKGINFLKEKWNESVESQTKANTKTKFWGQLTNNLTQSGQQLSQVGIVIYGVSLIESGDMSMGSLIACVILSGRALAPLGQITGLMTKINQAVLSYKQFGELMEENKQEAKREGQLDRDVDSDIELKEVSFSYDEGAPILKNLNLRISAGEKVAIVGRIGSGKTSILNLIRGLEKSTEGRVSIGGVSLNHLNESNLRDKVSVVSQNPYLFKGTIRENILLGSSDSDPKDIEEKSRLAGLDKIVNELPEGFETELKEGGQGLSGGQKQAVSIARAYMSDTDIILMDEPTSSMDTMTESEFISNLKVFAKDKTLIIVTHRNSILELVDRIIAIGNGQVVKDGKKKDFMKKVEDK